MNSPLTGGVLAAPASGAGDTAELRQLVHDIARQAYERRFGHRGVPDELDSALWTDVETTGLTRLTTTLDLGAGPEEAAVVLHGLARWAGAVPVAETDLLAGWLAERAGIEVPDEGPLTVAIADGTLDDGRAAGQAADVPWARDCATILVVLRTPTGVLAGRLQRADATLTSRHNLAGEPRDHIEFDIPAGTFTPLEPALVDELIRRGAWARCGQIIGALDAVSLSTKAHVSERVQFGRPLGKFQSAQQALSMMAGNIERARAAATLAVGAAAEYGFGSAQTDYALTIAKVTLGRTVGPATTIAHQLHGAIGVTAEHHLWLFSMRALSWITEFGSTAHYARRIGTAVLNSENSWDVLIGNDFGQWESLNSRGAQQ